MIKTKMCSRLASDQIFLKKLLWVFMVMFGMSGSGVAAERLTLIYSGNLDGELEPCGCSDEGNLGGIKRRASLLAQLRAQEPSLLLVSSGGLLQAEGSGDQLKSEYILRGFASLDYDAIGLQWGDLAFGAAFAKQKNLPWVASNWHDTGMAFTRILEKAGQRISFFSWLDPKASPLRQMQGDHNLVSDSAEKLQQALAQARQRGELTLLTTMLPAEQIARLIGLDDVDILIEQSAYEEYAEPRMLERTLVLTPGSRGMRLGRLDLEMTDGRIAAWQHEVLPMPASIPDAPQLAVWYEAYNAAVKAAYLKTVEARKTQRDGESPFAGEELCQACHADQHKAWSASQHAVAYEDLEAVGKAFDPECIGCHVVGFNQSGGFFDINITGHLMGVQCESCHGAGRDHAQSGGQKPVANKTWAPQQMCAQCHVQKHSPGFDFGSYWPKIAH